MSKGNAKQFLKECKNNEEVQRLLKEYPAPKNPDEAIAQVLEVAGRMGILITDDEIKEAVQELQEKQRVRTDAVVNDMEQLDDDELENVAGGFYYLKEDGQGGLERVFNTCMEDYTDTNCYNRDACGSVVLYYYDCNGSYFEDNEEYDCSIQVYCSYFYRFEKQV